MKPKRVLLLTVAYGGGHLQAAKAKKQELLSKDPHTVIYEVDILLDWVSRFIFKYYLDRWNHWQRTGQVVKQERLLRLQPIADILLWPFIFCRAFFTLLTKDIDQIIDTQNIGTSPLIKAIRFAKKFTKKNIYLEKVITELPTEEVTHFFRPIKGLSPRSRKMLKVISTMPLLKENQTSEDFWQEQCGLSEAHIQYGALPLRQSFIKLLDKKSKRKKLDLTLHVSNTDDLKEITSTMKRGSVKYKTGKNEIKITIDSEERVSIVMLGSRPNESATKEYVNHFINVLNQFKKPQKKDLLFVFCSSDKCANGYLLNKICKLVKEANPYPKTLTVIPLPYQDDHVIAPLFFRSDATFTRSGGLTAMELLSVCEGKIWIHAEKDRRGKSTITMPHWEEGNAYYLKQKKGAEFITPSEFNSMCRSYFS